MVNSVDSNPLNHPGFRSALRDSYKEVAILESISDLSDIELVAVSIEPYSVTMSYSARASRNAYMNPVPTFERAFAPQNYRTVVGNVFNPGKPTEMRNVEIYRRGVPEDDHFELYIEFHNPDFPENSLEGQ